MRKMLLAAVAIASAGCLSSGGNVQYLQVAMGQTSTYQGSNCPGVPNDVITNTGIDSLNTWAIYTAPNGQYLLDGASSGELLVGSLSGGAYTFVGSQVVEAKGNPDVTNTQKTTISLSPASPGPGYTGSVTTESICVSTGQNGAGCNGASAGAFDCTQTAPFTATSETNVAPEHVDQAGSGASSQTGGVTGGVTGGSNGGNGTSGGSGTSGGNGTSGGSGTNGGSSGTCSTSVCSGSSSCPQISCTCSSDGVVYQWQNCANGCCVNSCPGATGTTATGGFCITNCTCQSGFCNQSVSPAVCG
ncbi:MAG: hypothetical protein ACYCWW_20785 [Deltaproteobacteria bacterium]